MGKARPSMDGLDPPLAPNTAHSYALLVPAHSSSYKPAQADFALVFTVGEAVHSRHCISMPFRALEWLFLHQSGRGLRILCTLVQGRRERPCFPGGLLWGADFKAAVEVVKSAETTGHKKDLLCNTLPARILALISE